MCVYIYIYRPRTGAQNMSKSTPPSKTAWSSPASAGGAARHASRSKAVTLKNRRHQKPG